MRTNRRKFLSYLGVGAASAPLAAKAAAAELTTLAGHAATPLAVGSGIAPPGIPQSIEDQAKLHIRMSDYVRMFGKLPDHVERDVRERSRWVGHLDPDIASKLSWSLNVKIAEQRQRNYQREIDRYRDMGWYEKSQSAFQQLTGFRWGW